MSLSKNTLDTHFVILALQRIDIFVSNEKGFHLYIQHFGRKLATSQAFPLVRYFLTLRTEYN